MADIKDQYIGMDMRPFGGGFFQTHNFDGYNFSGCNLSNITLSGASFVGCNFSNAILNYASFEDTNCTNAIFIGATMIATIFTSCNLFGANFSNTDLNSINFMQVLDGREVNFRGCLFRTNTMDSQGDDVAGWNGSDFSNCVSGTECQVNDMTDANFINCNFSGADLRYADITGDYMDGANFTNAQMPLDANTKEKFRNKLLNPGDVRQGSWNEFTTIWVDGFPLNTINIQGAITGTRTGQNAILAMQPIDNMTNYEIRRNGVLIAETSDLTYTDTLISNIPNVYDYRGKIDNGNGQIEYSEYSPTITIRRGVATSIITQIKYETYPII